MDFCKICGAEFQADPRQDDGLCRSCRRDLKADGLEEAHFRSPGHRGEVQLCESCGETRNPDNPFCERCDYANYAAFDLTVPLTRRFS